MVFDLIDFRWITALRVVPLGGPQSPKTVLVQVSLSAVGPGPFTTVASYVFTKTNGSDATPQVITGFSEHGRFWRLLVLDTYGGFSVGIREVYFDGYTDGTQLIPFTLDNSGQFQMYYIPLGQSIQAMILRLRLDFFRQGINTGNAAAGGARPTHFDIDYIRIARAPEVHRVTGCIDVYYGQSSLSQPFVSVYPQVNWINHHLPLWYFAKIPLPAAVAPYATTYDCPLSGNVMLTVEGINFGSAPRIFIAGVECYVTALAPAPDAHALDSAQCLLPGADTGVRCGCAAWMPPVGRASRGN